jgi:Tn3 transposase DDE domain-containing protein
VIFYSWTSDQLSQYGTKVIPATVRDAAYVLDAILDNETELTILNRSTRDWYTHAATLACSSVAIFSTAAVTAGSS